MRISDWSSDVCSSDLEIAEQSVIDICMGVEGRMTAAGDEMWPAAPQVAVGRHRQVLVVHEGLVGTIDHRERATEALDRFLLVDAQALHEALDHPRSEEHTSELQSLMRHSYAVFCLKKKTK